MFYEKEQGIRAILNFGHTFAHAFENLINYDSKKLIHEKLYQLNGAH